MKQYRFGRIPPGREGLTMEFRSIHEFEGGIWEENTMAGIAMAFFCRSDEKRILQLSKGIRIESYLSSVGCL